MHLASPLARPPVQREKEKKCKIRTETPGRKKPPVNIGNNSNNNLVVMTWRGVCLYRLRCTSRSRDTRRIRVETIKKNMCSSLVHNIGTRTGRDAYRVLATRCITKRGVYNLRNFWQETFEFRPQTSDSRSPNSRNRDLPTSNPFNTTQTSNSRLRGFGSSFAASCSFHLTAQPGNPRLRGFNSAFAVAGAPVRIAFRTTERSISLVWLKSPPSRTEVVLESRKGACTAPYIKYRFSAAKKNRHREITRKPYSVTFTV